jgi:6-pyruvoyltetrahydropterin/6-carboxytetrahydropterin synthase
MMKYELTQRFHFDAAHTLQRQVDAEPSRRIHGHTYTAEVTVAGTPDPRTGMVVDLAHLRRALESVRDRLDHRLLDDVRGLGPATLENLCSFIARALLDGGWPLAQVVVRREASGDACCLRVGER